MSSSELTLGKIVQRFLLYSGIALAVLAVFAVAVMPSKGAKVSSEWIGLAVYTSGLFWVTISISRKYWHSPSFWLVIAGLLLVHLVAFVAMLRTYHQCRMTWFMPVVIVEGGLFGAILNLLLGSGEHS